MYKDRVKGATDQAKGMLTSIAGRALGADKLKTEDAGDKAKAEAEGAAGDLRDVVRDAANH